MLVGKSLLFYCGVLLALSSFSIDIMLPALADIGGELNASAAPVKMTVTFYLFAFGIGQVIFGPLSDRVGRKAALVVGLGMYLIGALVCAAALGIQMLLIGRFFQGIGGAAGHVIVRAVMRDLYSGRELARNMAVAVAVFSVGPLIAPLLGHALAVTFGWRAVFVGLLIYGGALLLAAVLALPETAKIRHSDACRLRVLVASVQRFFACRSSCYFALICGWTTIAMHFFLANAAQLYAENFGVVGLLFALLFASHGVGIIIGQITNRILIGKIGVIGSARVAAVVLTVSCAVLLFLQALGILNAAVFAIVMLLFATGFLPIISNTSSMALDEHGDMPGFASSAVGFCAMVLGASGASVLTLLSDGELLPWIWGMLFVCGGALCALFASKLPSKPLVSE